MFFFFFFQAEDGIRDADVTGVQTCALPISRRVCSGMVRLGVPLVPVDLARHAPEVTAPLRARHRAGEILTAPPNSQGLLLAEILAALECLHLPDPLGSDAGALAELFRLVSRDRDRHLGDPRWTDVPV